jgi:hypothetical protein
LTGYFATSASKKVSLKLPETFWTFQLTSYYVFVFTTDRKCLVYDITNVNWYGIFDLKATLYLPELDDLDSKIRIIPDYNVHN